MDLNSLEPDLFLCFNDKPPAKSLKRKKPSLETKGEKIVNVADEQKFSNKSSDESVESVTIDENILQEIQVSKILEVPCGMSCTHEVAVSTGTECKPLVSASSAPAKEYPFVLDDFQKQAILCIENGQSVLVSAHTSSGKTVVAEYAVAKCLKNHQRVIYTSPIKALSNQKYRELNEEFRDVGLQTGDVTLNPSASCVVMTTEILRSMLYRGSEILREVAWVIFDEIHYMRDKERGVVWEETIIMLPDNVRYVFLSATIPNACQFAEWISVIHSQPCNVVCTDFRPTPLQHYVFPMSGDSLYLIVDENGEFKEKHMEQALSTARESGSVDNSRNKNSATQNIVRITKFMVERKFAPVIIFSFSKKECEHYARSISTMDFNEPRDKKMISEVFLNAIEALSDEDKNLPQVQSVLPLLKRGIGIHHSGLLPILKEVTEILFSEGLIKFLFATETFAMGLNMPARTVVFTSCRKYDGVENRFIQSGEYIQMSGRAGRRGIDDRGICILMIDDQMTINTAKSLIWGTADPLNSAFRLTYNMILNLLRIEGIDPEYMMKKSFFQHQISSNVPEIIEKLKELKKEYDEIKIKKPAKLDSYVKLVHEEKIARKEKAGFLADPKFTSPFLQPGRLVKIKSFTDNFGWGCIVNSNNRKTVKMSLGAGGKQLSYVDVLLNCAIKTLPGSMKKTYLPSETMSPNIIPVACHLFTDISVVRIPLPGSLETRESKISILKSINEIERKFTDGGIPMLDPVKDMKIKDKKFLKLYDTCVRLHDRIEIHPIKIKLNNGSSKTLASVEEYERKLQILDKIKAFKDELKDVRSIVQLNDLKARKRVLRRLGFLDSSDMIDVKGRVACEISTADELVLTELIFNGFFNDISHRGVCAVLSCLLYQEKSFEGQEGLSEENKKLYRSLMETVKRVAKVSSDCKLQIDVQSYINGFKNDLMEVFSNWASGANFETVCKLSDVFEGSIIRCLRRLDELLKQLIQAAKVIGNAELEKKFKECSEKIKRNIAFSASLYL